MNGVFRARVGLACDLLQPWSHAAPRPNPHTSQGTDTMLHAAIVLFVLAIIAAVLGFGGLAAGAAGLAKILALVFIILAVVSFLVNSAKRAAA